jgi:hypothetical protein
MKGINLGFLSLLLLASPETQAQFTYVTNGDAITITRYTGPTGAITIPASTNGLPVTSVGSNAFQFSLVISVTIPNGVTNIGAGAFNYCQYMTSITIPESVISIGDNAFSDCFSLTNVAIPAGVTNIGAQAFENCWSVASVTIPSGVTNIEYEAFASCTNLTNATLSDVEGSIASSAFDGCAKLASITIPGTVTCIGSNAFNGCASLTSIEIPASVTNIGEGAFENCSSMTNLAVDSQNLFYSSVNGVLFDRNRTTLLEYPGGAGGDYVISTNVNSIGSYAFCDCESLSNVHIPNSVIAIGSYGFYGCSGLTNIILPDSVTSVGDFAFSFDINLTGLTISDSITNMGKGIFEDCTALTSVAIPQGITSISDQAFQDCVNLTNVSFSDSLMSIGTNAFEDCRSLNCLTIPDSVTSIGDSAFSTCPALTNLTILGGVTNIGSGAFYLCGLIRITINGNVTSIGSDAFLECYNLTSAYFTGNAPIADSSVFNSDSLATMYFLPGTSGWNSSFGGISTEEVPPYNFTINPDGTIAISGYTGPGGTLAIPATIIGLPVTSIGQNAFENLNDVTNVVIPGAITSIANGAFQSCLGLTNVYFESNAPAVGSSTFFGDSATVYYLPGTTGWSTTLGGIPAEVLPSPYSFTINADETTTITGYTGSGGNVTIPASIIGLPVSIGNYAFEDVTDITNVIIADGVTSIGNYAFYMFDSLTSVTIPGSVTNIGQAAFAYCPGLTNVTIANGVVSIGTQAFLECSSLTSLTIPGSVTSIGESAFALAGLTRVYFTGDAPAVGPLLFSGYQSATIYYLPGTAGWGEFSLNTGETSVPWTPVIQTGDGGFGVRNNQFGFNITNTSFSVSLPPVVIHDPSVVVEVCTNLANPVWIPIQTVILTDGWFYFSEPFQPNIPARFYGLGLP